MIARRVTEVNLVFADGGIETLEVEGTYVVRTNHEGGRQRRDRLEWDEHEVRWSTPRRPVRQA